MPRRTGKDAAVRSASRAGGASWPRTSVNRPRRFRFRRDPLGGVTLDHPAGLTFSTSHAGEISLLAVGLARPLGIDVEPRAAADQIEEIADAYLPVDRVRRVRQRPLHRHAESWVRLWTELEACSKLCGRGLGDLSPATAETLLRQPCHRVHLRPDRDHEATLVYGGSPARVTCFLFGPEWAVLGSNQ